MKTDLESPFLNALIDSWIFLFTINAGLAMAIYTMHLFSVLMASLNLTTASIWLVMAFVVYCAGCAALFTMIVFLDIFAFLRWRKQRMES